MLLKIVLTPLLILLSLMATHRWGAFAGGILAGLPLISGPLSLFLTIEQGAEFSAQASYNTLLGVTACAATALSYPWLAVLGLSWSRALPLSIAAFFGFGKIVLLLPHNIWLASALALAAPLYILFLLPRGTAPSQPVQSGSRRTKWLIPVQMLFGAGLVCAVTTAASRLGSGWSGVLMFFPVMICSVTPYLHVTGGAAAVVLNMRGLMTGWFGGIAFTLVVLASVRHLPIWLCYSLAAAAALTVSFCLTWLESKLRLRC